MAPEAELVVEGGVARLWLRRPEARNALTPSLVESLAGELASPALASAGALVLCGEGSVFCAGADLDLVREAASQGDSDPTLGRLLAGVHALVRALREVPVPVVAAVEGAAAGAGMGLALAADLRVLGRSAVFVPAYLAIGASPDAGVSYHLARSLGGPRAGAALIRNRRLPATELFACGLADEVVDDGEALDAALRLAREVAATAPLALLATRRLLDAAPTQGLDAHLDAEAAEIRELWTTAGFAEGVAAFLDRRRLGKGGRPPAISR
jgi:2-(1,2-epoxy-1,2-dihydrophenyl)acetyl-CoA isomerase